MVACGEPKTGGSGYRWQIELLRVRNSKQILVVARRLKKIPNVS